MEFIIFILLFVVVVTILTAVRSNKKEGKSYKTK